MLDRRHSELTEAGAEATEARGEQRGVDFVPFFAVGFRGVAFLHHRSKDLLDAPPSLPAWRAFAARLECAEIENVMDQFLDRGAFVKGDDAAVTDHRANHAQLLETELGVEQVRRNDAGERASNDDALERAIFQSAADLLDDVAHGDSEIDLVQAGALEERVERDE